MTGKPNPKDAAAASQGKPDMSLLPPAGAREQAFAHMCGAAKYGPYNWRQDKIRLSVYVAAIIRHATAIMNGEDKDPESGRSHFGHIMASAAIPLDAEEHGTLIDDRVLPKRTA